MAREGAGPARTCENIELKGKKSCAADKLRFTVLHLNANLNLGRKVTRDHLRGRSALRSKRDLEVKALTKVVHQRVWA